MRTTTQLSAIGSLIEAISDEVALYKQIVARYDEQAKRHAFSDMSYHAMRVWNELIKAEIDSLQQFIADYLQRHDLPLDLLASENPKIKRLAQLYFEIIENVKTIDNAEKLDANIKYDYNINPFSPDDKELVKKINELRLARLSKVDEFQRSCSPAASSTEEDSPFEGHRFKGIKNGGANLSGGGR